MQTSTKAFLALISEEERDALERLLNGPDLFGMASFLLSDRAYALADRARRILTISESTRRDIVRLLSVPEQRVDVTYPAAEERYRLLPATAVEGFRQARGLPESFVFAVGTLEPRKNLVGLLHAFARLRERIR